MVSDTDVQNVQDTWGKIYERWDAQHAKDFYNNLFDHNEEISSAFAKAGTNNGIGMKMQALKFGTIVEEFVNNLKDPSALHYKILALCDTHKTRGITNMALFEFALADLVDYISGHGSFTAAQRKSWEAVNSCIIQQMSAYFVTL